MTRCLLLVAVAAGAFGQPPAATDRHGDALPDGAVARLGTERFRLGGSVTALAYSADGKLLAASSNGDNQVAVWEVPSGKRRLRFTLPGGDTSGAVALRFTAGDARLVSLGGRGVVRVHDLATGKELPDERERGVALVMATPSAGDAWGLRRAGPVASADGRLVATPADKAVAVTEKATGRELHRLVGHGGDIFRLAFSVDGKTLLSTAFDSTVRLWDLGTGKERARVEPGHGNPVAVLSPDGKTVATGGANSPHAVVFWDAATGKPDPAFPAGNTGPVYGLAVSPDGQLAATASWVRGEATIWLWEAATGKPVGTLSGHARGTFAVAFAPDGRRLASSGWSGDPTVRVWDVASGREVHTLAGHQAGVTCLSFSPDGKRLASGDSFNRGAYFGRVRLWDADGGKLVHELSGPAGAVRAVAFTPDGRTLLAAHDQGVHLWDAVGGRPLGALPGAVQANDLALSPDGQVLATVPFMGRPQLWELATRRPIATLPAGVTGVRVAFAADGRFLAVGGEGAVHVYDRALREKALTRPGHRDNVAAVAFAPDGTRLFSSAGQETCALVWDVAAVTARPLPALPKADPAELDRLRADLGGADADAADRAAWALARRPDQAVPLLRDATRVAPVPDRARIARLVRDLDADDFETREAASAELAKAGEAAAEPLRDALRDKPSVEQARRIDELLKKLGPDADRLRAARAVAALERIGTAEAVAVLKAVAAGDAASDLGRDARLALARLAARR